MTTVAYDYFSATSAVALLLKLLLVLKVDREKRECERKLGKE